MTAIFPGSFDPVTNGHINLIERSATMFDQVIVAVLDNNEKTPLFTKEERVQMLKTSLPKLDNVNIESYSGLTVDFAKKKNAKILIRGIRNEEDISYEKKLYDAYKSSYPELEIIYLDALEEYKNISSTSVKCLFSNNEDISALVPSIVIKELKKKIK